MLKNLYKHISNIPGWCTNRKIVVFESDDWGSIRMPSRESFNRLKKNGLPMSGESLRYNQFDTLASPSDLKDLFQVLQNIKDVNGNHPVFTAISLMANPDFDKIKATDYQEYHFESFPETLKRYGHKNALSVWKEGIDDQVFIPQFHAREHLNVPVWMRALKNKDKSTLLAFDERCWSFDNHNQFGISYVAPYDLEYKLDLQTYSQSIKNGLDIFEELFSYRANFFVPPNGPFNNSLEEVAALNGIKFMSASKWQKEPQGKGKSNSKFHFLGQRNKWSQRYITRNCFFEPNYYGDNCVDNCLKDIALAFRWNKPAVISTHRINYVSGLDKSNQLFGLDMLTVLLNQILVKWPSVEFKTSSELGSLIIDKG